MACSPEQLASIRRNSLKSSGPKSTYGKSVVRRNALKHGLTGAGIVVPDEDVAVIQERFEAFNDDLNPNHTVSEFLVRHLALMSVRMERGARQEAANLTKNMLLAEQAEADAERAELQALADRISEVPEVASRDLQRSPRGIGWMIREWEDLKADLAHTDSCRWNSARIERAENLIGHRCGSSHLSRIGVLSYAYLGNFSSLNPDDWPDLPREERSQAARAELDRIMDAEIARLKVVLEGLDHEKLAKIESGAMTRALFDASKEAVLARKYEAAAERGFYKALKTILEVDALANADKGPDDTATSSEPEKDSGELALNCIEEKSGSEPAETVAEPIKRRPPAPADRRKSRSRKVRRTVEVASDRLRE